MDGDDEEEATKTSRDKDKDRGKTDPGKMIDDSFFSEVFDASLDEQHYTEEAEYDDVYEVSEPSN